jgi:hypothetical protein
MDSDAGEESLLALCSTRARAASTWMFFLRNPDPIAHANVLNKAVAIQEVRMVCVRLEDVQVCRKILIPSLRNKKNTCSWPH